MSIKVTDNELLEAMTSSLRNDWQFASMIQAFQPLYDQLIGDIRAQLAFRVNLPTCSDIVLLHLATEFRLDVVYNANLPRAIREDLIRNAPQWLARHGTKSVIDEVTSTIFNFAAVQENWEYDGNPYHFRILTTDPVLDPNQIAYLYNIVLYLKNVRSVFDGVFRFGKAATTMYTGAAIGVASHQVVRFTNG
jgi:P2-related tail formation protein